MVLVVFMRFMHFYIKIIKYKKTEFRDELEDDIYGG